MPLPTPTRASNVEGVVQPVSPPSSADRRLYAVHTVPNVRQCCHVPACTLRAPVTVKTKAASPEQTPGRKPGTWLTWKPRFQPPGPKPRFPAPRADPNVNVDKQVAVLVLHRHMFGQTSAAMTSRQLITLASRPHAQL